ncbi:MAG: hypothetical protein A3F91_03945 [Flavobacteria bacterium RIFCSPLOWO2_12_FULL_35_11]|nr:MAG: hypothetical protein A3F91_03945 [Flavobacteria bacterium RIFCSPLOWO2_12_FULL_35_11]
MKKLLVVTGCDQFILEVKKGVSIIKNIIVRLNFAKLTGCPEGASNTEFFHFSTNISLLWSFISPRGTSCL